MMDLLLPPDGLVQLRLVSADTGCLLSVLEARRIRIQNVRALDELTLEFEVRRRNMKELKSVLTQKGIRFEIIGRSGIFWKIRSILNRPLVVTGLLTILILGFFLPTRVLFVAVEGNDLVPARMILEAAERAGLKFGTSRRSIRSEQIKNELLEAVPALKWAGVNTYGSRAVITVRERDDTAPNSSPVSVRHIVAARDGIVTSCTVTAGCAACTVGQAVNAGDVLISGYTDCGLLIRADVATGQILAETKRDLTVVTPAKYSIRGLSGNQDTRFSLILGKKRINFYKGSGISGGSCVKMSREYVLRLPGGYSLPVVLVKEVIQEFPVSPVTAEEPGRILTSCADRYLDTQMVSGTVLKKSEAVTESDGVWILKGLYACIEDIGVIQDEKIGDLHGKADGTDRERGPGG